MTMNYDGKKCQRIQKKKKIEKGKDSLRGLNPERFLEILNKKK